jgi:anaerobic magnesium-protoporphyrin IX monomethyl ester cyclase
VLNPPFMPRFGRSARWQNAGRGGTLYYPIWLSYATGLLEKAGHDVKLVDAPAKNFDLEYIVKDVAKYNPDLVVIDTSFTSLKNDLNVATVIKKTLMSTIIVGVGPPTSQFPRRMLSEGFNVVARYEYDWTLAELLDGIEKGTDMVSITGISYKNSNQRVIHNRDRILSTDEDLDELPFVSKAYFKHLNIYDYYLSSSLFPEVQIMASRGCPHRCSFCSWPQTFTGRVYRKRSVDNVFNELIWIKQNLKAIKEVVFEDDTFGLGDIWIERFCRKIIDENVDVTWNCQIRAGMKPQILNLMARAGCRLVIVGFESAEQKILNNVEKGTTVSQLEKMAADVRKAGIQLHADFVFGLPGETRGTMLQTIKFIRKIKPDVVQLSIATPFPGTDFYNYLRDHSYLKIENVDNYLDEKGNQRCIIDYPWLKSYEIEQLVDQALKQYYFSLSYVPTFLRQMTRKNRLEETRRIVKAAISLTKYMRNH